MLSIVEWKPFISRNPAILQGKPTIAGTRIPVDLVLQKLADSVTIETLLEDYPALSREAIRACLAFAAHLASEDETMPLFTE